MSPLQQQLYWWHERLGKAGTAALALLLCAAAGYAMAVVPAQQTLTQLEQTLADEEHSARTKVQRAREIEESESSRQARLYNAFPQPREISKLLKKLYAAADKAKLTLQRGDYKLSRDSSGLFMRYEIELPLQGSYSAIQSFIYRSLKQMPTLALDDIRFKRESANSRVVQAKLHFILYLLEGS